MKVTRPSSVPQTSAFPEVQHLHSTFKHCIPALCSSLAQTPVAWQCRAGEMVPVSNLQVKSCKRGIRVLTSSYVRVEIVILTLWHTATPLRHPRYPSNLFQDPPWHLLHTHTHCHGVPMWHRTYPAPPCTSEAPSQPLWEAELGFPKAPLQHQMCPETMSLGGGQPAACARPMKDSLQSSQTLRLHKHIWQFQQCCHGDTRLRATTASISSMNWACFEQTGLLSPFPPLLRFPLVAPCHT